MSIKSEHKANEHTDVVIITSAPGSVMGLVYEYQLPEEKKTHKLKFLLFSRHFLDNDKSKLGSIVD
jgi:hypothetical protein